MKIISWNCNMAFRKKMDKVLQLKPDLLILIECENKAKLEPALADLKYDQLLWYGDNPHKGIAIISFGDYDLNLKSSYNPEFKYILPFSCKIADKPIDLYVVWAMPYPGSTLKSYVGQVWRAINYYQPKEDANSIWIGDFNSNAIWDSMRKKGHHTDVVAYLAQQNIFSLYHLQTSESPGQESQPTQYMYRHLDKPYHLDYCFMSQHMIGNDTTLELGTYDDWIDQSDHMPIIVEF